jgi:peptidyl-prolyl cis-trans isomerase SurA
MSLKQAFAYCLFCSTLAIGMTSMPVQAQNNEDIDSIIALVDQDVIMRSELDTAIKGIVDRIRAQGGNLPPQNLLEKQVLERLVIRKLQLQRALQTGIRVSDADIDQAVTGLADQNGLTVMQMRRVIESDGEDFAEFRRNIGEEILGERLRQRIVNSMDPISDTEVDILLASEEFAGGEYNISHIMLNLPEGSTPKQIAAMQARINEIHAQLEDGLDFASAAISYSQSQEALEGGEVGWRDLNSVPEHHARHILIETNELITAREAMEEVRGVRQRILDGEDFAELAKEYSDDPTSANIGGDMGWFQEGAYGDRVEQMLAGLAENEISEPFQSQVGWHIIENLGFREVDITEAAIRQRARESIRQSKSDEEVDRFLRQMREEAFGVRYGVRMNTRNSGC